ncbi:MULTISPECIES: response regulator transcription factor [Pseudomonadaceae]|uniref:LuxR family transcriptional regulator n=1 Tax=Pseudomonas abyssi TaxID=170540 RepID=A0A395QYC2_9PSED|nr:response regulator transcription factor [Halopseudomonas gallaeciensis]MAG65308.1 DNA-binding response regulator [Pseudomonadales bacterium]RGP52499.1 LuxR family transcriptional regulator [Halopseudomonas gallaeciensis]|tara:strand:- start:124 stop:765 length:642 start_codon:yes stop_codon:yes gene_type:complete
MNLLLVDDHPMVRHGCACLLGEMLPQAEIRAVESGEDALVAAQQRVPDLVLLDIGLPGISGIETARRLLQRWPLLRILFLSMHDELPLVRQALAAGALGYITKTASPEVLCDAVGRCLKGHRYIEQELATQLACAGSDERLDPRLRDVTQREFEIFVMLARGVAPRLIAENLCISSKTVSNNLTVLKQKLNVSSLTELVHLAIDTGVLRVQRA